ncbi:hypothetical protein ACAW74_16430 [Fibrella sp. WM1]|uniref:hypothetical protein n=1 Tax=Fibrella musci TaxID=3242485 RepID=UPI003522DE8D
MSASPYSMTDAIALMDECQRNFIANQALLLDLQQTDSLYDQLLTLPLDELGRSLNTATLDSLQRSYRNGMDIIQTQHRMLQVLDSVRMSDQILLGFDLRESARTIIRLATDLWEKQAILLARFGRCHSL